MIHGGNKKWPVDGILPNPHRIRFMVLPPDEDDKLQLRVKRSAGKPLRVLGPVSPLRSAIYKEMKYSRFLAADGGQGSVQRLMIRVSWLIL